MSTGWDTNDGKYAKIQGDYAKQQAEYAKSEAENLIYLKSNVLDAVKDVDTQVVYAKEMGDYAKQQGENIEIQEDSRQANENSRIQNEGNRKSAEETRNLNENSRKNNELARQTAEDVRNTNEIERIATHQQMMDVLPNVTNLENMQAWNSETQYYKNNIVVFNGSGYMALQDSLGQTPPTLPTLSNEHWVLMSRKGDDGTGNVNRVRDVFTATEGQTDFTLSQPYDQFQNRIEVFVGNIPQFSPDNFIELSSTQIRFTEGLPAGVEVIATYYTRSIPLASDIQTTVDNHTTTLNNHEIRVAETETNVTSLTAQLAEKANQNEVRLKTKKIELEDMSESTLGAMSGQSTFNLLSVPQDNSVTPKKTTFIKQSTNIFHENNRLTGYVVDAVTGELNPSETYFLTDFLEVNPSTKYTFHLIVYVAFYDLSKNFLGRVYVESTTTTTTPEDCAYIRAGYTNVYGDKQINEGDTLLNYEPWYPSYLEDVKVGESVIDDNAITVSKVRDNAITSSKRTTLGELPLITFSKSANELPNLDTVNGEISFPTTFFIFHRDKRYTITNGITINYFNAGNTSAYVIYFDTESQSFFVKPQLDLNGISENSIVFAVVFNSMGKWSLNINCEYTIDGKPIYHPYNESLIGEKPYKFSIEKLMGDYPNSDLIGIGDIDSPFDYDNDNHELVYGLFDELMNNNPDYITRESLGVTSTNIPIYKYEFNPRRPILDPGVIKPFPKIILGGAIHGGENLAVASLYYLFKRICEDWKTDKTLEYLRHNIRFVVVPLQNPQDYDDKAYVGLAGVNLNRDFDYNWIKQTGTGDVPFSRVESQIIRDMLFDNKDAVFYIDCHVRGAKHVVDDWKILWIANRESEQAQFGANTIEQISRRFKGKYPQLPDNPYSGTYYKTGTYYGYQTISNSSGVVSCYSHYVVGIPSVTWEGFSASTTMNVIENKDVVDMNVDMLGQYVVNVIKYYQQ